MMIQSDWNVCPSPDCDEPVFINAASFEDGILSVDFECPGCGLEDNLQHENPDIK